MRRLGLELSVLQAIEYQKLTQGTFIIIQTLVMNTLVDTFIIGGLI